MLEPRTAHSPCHSKLHNIMLFSLPRTSLPRLSCISRRWFSSTPRVASVSEYDHDSVFGIYNVILPHEPFVFGVSHIKPRQVPPSIPRPPYALQGPKRHSSLKPEPKLNADDGKIPLGSEEEEKMRRVCALARDVREFCADLVKVCLKHSKEETH